MDVHQDNMLPGHPDEPTQAEIEHRSSQRLTAFFTLVLAILLVAAAWLTNEVGSTHASTMAEVDQAAQEFEYFPSRFTNQATEIERHIEAY